MDKARGREFVERLPAETRDQLVYKEQVHDKQILLNENWTEYAVRTSKADDQVCEEHVKWITETWEEYEARKRGQRKALAHYDAQGEADLQRKKSQQEQERQRSDQVIARLMKFRSDAQVTLTPSRHHLYADFDEYQRIKFAREQLVIASAESFLRSQIENWQESVFALLQQTSTFDRFCMATMQAEREAREAAEQKRLEEERQRALEEARRRELERKRLEEEEAQRKKEQAELEKRLDRKRREEERRAKARADRERQKEMEAAQSVDLPVTNGDADGENGAPPPPHENSVDESQHASSRIDFQPLQGDNIISLLKKVTKILSSGGDSCYVMAVRKNPCASSVICQNGFFLGEDDENAPLLGKRIESDTCISVSSEKLHSASTSNGDEKHYKDNHVVHVDNVQTNDSCMPFCEGASKEAETLSLFPVFCQGISYSPYIVGLCRTGANMLSDDEKEQAAQLVFSLCERLAALQRQAFLHQLCQQCVEWINVSTGCEHVYVSLRDTDDSNSLTYVAATESHRFMVGKRHSRSEENEGRGISFYAMDQSVPEKQVRVFSVADVSSQKDNAFGDRSIRFFTEGDKKGSLVVAPITGVKEDQGESVGVVFLDRIDSKKKFSPIDLEVTRAATQLLADLILGNETVPALKLRIEDEMGDSGAPITFLKALWHKSLQELEQITPNQLLELAKYLHPPPIIPIVVQATELVALGCKPKSIEDWDDARKRVTRKLLDKMLVFDPTDTKARKRAFFIRSRKLLKGMTADAVFEKGSYPTQCFFKWTFTALLLRKHAETIQKQLKEGRNDGVDAVSLFSNSTAGAESLEEDDNFEDTVDDTADDS